MRSILFCGLLVLTGAVSFAGMPFSEKLNAEIVTPPHAGYAAFNVCPAPDKAIFVSVGFGHSIGKAGAALKNLRF